jgi:hypothetical protein
MIEQPAYIAPQSGRCGCLPRSSRYHRRASPSR